MITRVSLDLRRWAHGRERSSGAAGGSSARGTAPKPMAAHGRVSAGRRWRVVNAVDRVIRWSTPLAVLGAAAVAAVVSYEHASDLVRAHGESGWTGRFIYGAAASSSRRFSRRSLIWAF